MKDLILAIDQGTSGSKAVIFHRDGRLICEGRAPLNSFYPREGFVEQNPEEIYTSVLSAVKNSLESLKEKGKSSKEIACCGISNQRETFLIWDREGNPLTNAIVWQCKRSTGICQGIKERGEEEDLRKRTGLFADPYFSGTKLFWLMENDQQIREAVKGGKALFGTIDTWLLFKLTNGKEYKTDYTNASRTLLFNLKELEWDRDILKKYGLSALNLPQIYPSGADFGTSDFNGLFETRLSISAMLGDSHAAAFGERCFTPGSAKATLGTGSSVLLNTGKMVPPENTTMVSTICWSIPGEVSYALEGIIVSCASTMNWLSEQLDFFKSGKEADDIAESLDDNGGVYLIPAFSGLGAPWWKMNQKAQIHGLTFDTSKKHIVRAGLESIAFQLTDVIGAMEKESKSPMKSLQIDGGISSSSFVTPMIAGLNNVIIMRNRQKEASAQGAALMAGLQYGIYQSLNDISTLTFDEEIIPEKNDPIMKQSYKNWIQLLQNLN
jgi:glycerol kinase